MNSSKPVVDKIDWLSYGGEVVRSVVLKDGTVLFLAADIANNIIGVKNPFSLVKAVDHRNKVELVISFDEGYNVQRYIFVNLEGLRCMVYRARSCKVNRYDFIMWAQRRA